MPAKTTKKAPVKKTEVKSEPVMEHKCECGENCKCHCHGRAHLIKHIIILALVFALGMVCGRVLYFGPAKHKPAQQRMHPVFVNGCLDAKSVTNKRLQEKLATADADKNECISMEEYRAARRELFPVNKGQRGINAPKAPKAQKPADLSKVLKLPQKAPAKK